MNVQPSIAFSAEPAYLLSYNELIGIKVKREAKALSLTSRLAFIE